MSTPSKSDPGVVKSVVHQLWALRGPLVTGILLIALLPLALSQYISTRCSYVVLVMAGMWLTEAIPISVTALLPMFMFPALGVQTAADVSRSYINDTSMLFLGGLMLAVAIEDVNLHKRIAVGVLRIVGADPKLLMLGLMVPTWFLSMWISNTATTSMMLPIANAVLIQMANSRKEQKADGVILTEKSSPPGNNHVTWSPAPKEKYTYRGKDNLENGTVVEDHNLNHVSRHRKSDVIDSDITDPMQARTETKVQLANKEVTSLDEIEKGDDTEKSAEYLRMCKGLCLCIAYASNIGGIATLTGTAPNLVFKGVADDLFNKLYKNQSKEQLGSGVTFANWMGMAVPMSALALVLSWVLLALIFLRSTFFRKISSEQKLAVANVIKEQWKEMGRLRLAEIEVLVLFIVLAFLWICRDPGESPGWAALFPKGFVSDTSAAMFIVTLLFLLPAEVPRVFCLRKEEYKNAPFYRPLLTWEKIDRKLPWGVIILLGGGFAMANACKESGLSTWLGSQLDSLSHLDPWILNLILCFIVSVATEVTSNTATSTLLMPIMAEIALSIKVNPLYLMASSAMATSFAFMLPVATPPNAIVFSSGHLRVIDMASAGFVMNTMAILCLTLAVNTWGNAIYKFDTLPDIFKNVSVSSI